MFNKHNSDFNSFFWKLFGVNHHVYQPLDVFKRKRDKRSDEKNYNNFINNPSCLSNELFFIHSNKMEKDFHDLILKVADLKSNNTIFYANEIVNALLNYRMFSQYLNLKEKHIINLFSFQVAYILEYMNTKNLDTSLFDQALLDSSIMPYIDMCKQSNKIKTNKQLAWQLAYESQRISERNKHNFNLEVVQSNKFEVYLSAWKNSREFPNFINMLLIITLINKAKNVELKRAWFFQLLIIRSLLYIQKKFNFSIETKNRFVKQLSKFRKLINNLYKNNKEDKIRLHQNKYLIDFTIENDLKEEEELIIYLQKNLFPKMEILFNSNIELNDMNNEDTNEYELLNQYCKKINNSFSQCSGKEDFNNLLSQIYFKDINTTCSLLHNQISTSFKLIIALKLNNRLLINSSIKELDRFMGGIYTQTNIQDQINNLIKQLIPITCLGKATEIINKHFEKFQI